MSKRNGIALLPKKREAFVAIRRFMCDGDVTLKVEEEAILNRWIFCDALLKAKEDDEDAIIDKIMSQFGVSHITARKDISNTQRLFADARRINKKYLIHHHLERIDRDIQLIRKKLFSIDIKDGNPVQSVPDSKEMAAYAKLLETYTYTLNSIPEEVQIDKQPPPVFQFILAPGQVINSPLALEDAIAKADEIILKPNNKGVYTMGEDDEQ